MWTTSIGKKFENFLLLSKRSRAMIVPVGNLKVDLP
jgi:hypothetical protein